MLTLLKDTKTRLRSSISYIRNNDIYITEDIRLVRKSGNYPAIGIKDGGIQFSSLVSVQDDDTLQLTIVAYVSLQKQEAMIIGTSTYKGVLEVATDIITHLSDHTFNDRFETALPLSLGESEILVEDGKAIMMVPVVMQFVRFSSS